MRQSFFNFIFSLALCVTIGAAPQAQAADEVVEELRRIEQRGLSKLSAGRLSDLLSAPVPRHDGVQFTRAWLDSQPAASGGADLRCLSEALYFEARGETVKGQFAVAEVIVNRVKSARFPDTICGVINQGTGRKFQCQFTYTCDGKAETINEPAAFARVRKVAKAMIDGRVPPLTRGATHYHTTAVKPNWASVYTRTARIGVHIFYRHTFRTASN